MIVIKKVSIELKRPFWIGRALLFYIDPHSQGGKINSISNLHWIKTKALNVITTTSWKRNVTHIKDRGTSVNIFRSRRSVTADPDDFLLYHQHSHRHKTGLRRFSTARKFTIGPNIIHRAQSRYSTSPAECQIWFLYTSDICNQ